MCSFALREVRSSLAVEAAKKAASKLGIVAVRRAVVLEALESSRNSSAEYRPQRQMETARCGDSQGTNALFVVL
jgi:hypothetical protein